MSEIIFVVEEKFQFVQRDPTGFYYNNYTVEEEEKILDPEFQQQMADKIVLGVKDFLESCRDK